MMGSEGQQVKSGNNCKNTQVKELTINNYGLSFSDARDIAQDIFDKNFYRLSSMAEDIAKERAGRFIDMYLDKLRDANPDAIDELKNPDMQYSLFTAQKEYARSGDDELGEMLVRILADRTLENRRTLKQIVLNESLSVVPKLVKSQINILTLVFLLRYTKSLSIDSTDALRHYIEQYLQPFLTDITYENVYYQHLEFCGCGMMKAASANIEDILRRNYPRVFSGMISEDSNMQKSYEIKKYLNDINPSMAGLLHCWDHSPMQNMNLTSVGIAIAHTNLTLHTGFDQSLSVWIK